MESTTGSRHPASCPSCYAPRVPVSSVQVDAVASEVVSESAERRFAGVAARFLDEPDVSSGTGFGKCPGLRTGGKIFAMLVHDRLVVKPPSERVGALIAAGAAERFSSGRRRPMKEWASIGLAGTEDWQALADEARHFVRRDQPR